MQTTERGYRPIVEMVSICIVLLVLSLPDPASACSLNVKGLMEAPIHDHVRQADAVFKGTIVAVWPEALTEGYGVKAYVFVTEDLKGGVGRMATIRGFDYWRASKQCSEPDVGFGSRYIFFATKDGNEFIPHSTFPYDYVMDATPENLAAARFGTAVVSPIYLPTVFQER